MTSKKNSLVLLIFVFPFISFGQKIIRDLTTSNASSYPTHFVNAGSKSFFFAKRSTGEMDLWTTDGTDTGTVPLSGSGIPPLNNPGFTRITSQPTTDLMVRLGNKLIFKAYATTPFLGEELWISDGTNTGTKLLKDIKTGTSSSDIEMFVSLNDKVIFLSSVSYNNNKSIWVTDGTADGTHHIKDMSISRNSNINIHQWKVINNKLFFIVQTPFEGTELWVTDGTSSGTSIVKDIAAGSASSYPSNLTVISNKLFFQARVSGNMNSLFVTDGTSAGTLELLNMEYNTLDGAAYNNKLFFRHSTSSLGAEVWTSDGTIAGTHLFKDLNSAGSSSPSGFFASNNLLFFSASEDGNSKVLWKSNGTSTGTTKVQNSSSSTIAHNPIRWDINPYALSMGDYFVFEANYTNSDSTEIWRSNGTSEGTFKLKRLKKSPNYLEINQSGRFENHFCFHENNQSEERYITWISDGTENGTKRLENLSSLQPIYRPETIGLSSNSLYFSAFDESVGYELYKSNGLTSNLIKDLNVQIHSDQNNLYYRDTLDNHLYFTYNNNKNGLELWKTDGSSGNTSLFHEFTKGTSLNSDYQNWLWSNSTKFDGLVSFQGKLYISANKQLYVSNGISKPTILATLQANSSETLHLTKVNDKLFVTDSYKVWVINSSHLVTEILNTNSYYSIPSEINTHVGGVFIFTMYTSNYGRELWRSDGTVAGTFLLRDLNTGTQNTTFSKSYITCNGKLFFSAWVSGVESMWVTDGTQQGTVSIKDFSGSNGWTSPGSYTCIDNQEMLFSAYSTSSYTRQLWKSNGTSPGTNAVTAVPSMSFSSSSRITDDKNYPFPTLGNNVFFNAIQNGYSHLYKYDGSNTTLLKSYFNMSEAIIHNQKLYLAGQEYNTGKGEELWASDGTVVGTVLVKDINPGSNSSNPLNFFSFNQKLIFIALHNSTGYEPWVMEKKCPENLVLSDPIDGFDTYKASKSITGEINNRIIPNAKINYRAGEFVLINPGFEASYGSVFQTDIGGCEDE